MTPGLVKDFKMPKSKGGGEFTINYMEGSYNKEGEFGEFYLEFQEKVWEHKVVEQFKYMGAGQVSTITFQHNDGQESASNALLRVWQLGEKTGYHENRGKCPEVLMSKTRAKLEESKKAAVKGEFDEKVQAALKASLDGIEGKVEDIHVDVKDVGVDIKDVRNQLGTINDALVARNKFLEKEIKRVNLLRDRLEFRIGQRTRVEKELDWALEDLEKAMKEIKDLKEQLAVYKALETAKWMLETERAVKRARED